jgi:putative two-component system response regulator
MVDIYDAIISRRSYKEPYSPDEALTFMQEEVDRGWRDPALFSVFLSIIRQMRRDKEAAASGSGE